MKCKKINMNGYNIHLIKTNKFKTTTISVNLREKLTKETITLRKLLFEMLHTSSKKYNTNRLLQIELENLYSLSLGYANIAYGNVINSYIDFKFINSEYSNDKLLSQSIDLLSELFLKPNIVNNEFDKKQFEISKGLLQLILNSRKENTPKYALTRSLELMDNDDPAAINLWGYQEELDKITPKSLYEYYKKVINEDAIDIFIVGNVDEKEIIKLFEEKFNVKKRKEDNYEPFIIYDKCSDTLIKEETMNIKQSRLSIVCKILNLTTYERRYVLPLYTDILGGMSTSRLFMNVREKNSLAYTISSLPKGPNSLFFITAGIESANYNKTVELINKELYLDKITVNELKEAKEEIISSLKGMYDDPTSIINYYFGMEVFDADKLEDKISNFEKVTKKEIIDLSKKIKVAIIYLLKGDNNEKN